MHHTYSPDQRNNAIAISVDRGSGKNRYSCPLLLHDNGD